MKYLKPNTERAKAAIILLAVAVCCEFGMIISELMQYTMLEEVNNGRELTMAEADTNDTRQALVGVLYLVVLIISCITFILWFRRAYFNLGQRTMIKRDDAWAGGAWFVPIISLFWPYQIMAELYEKTPRYINTKTTSNIAIPSLMFVGLWWTFWIINNILGQIVFRHAMAAESVEELMTNGIISVSSSVIGAIGGLLAIKVVRDYSEIEKVLFIAKEKEVIVPVVAEISAATEEE